MAEGEVKEEDIELTGKTLYMVPGQVEIALGRFRNNPENLIVVKKLYPIDNDYEKMKREVISLYKLNHPAIPKFYGYYWSDWNGVYLLCVLIEYFKNGDLSKEIIKRKNNPWSEAELLYHFGYLLDAYAYMESVSFAHRDIKPENIFIGDDGNFKVGDFGCSIQSFEHQLRELATISGSPIYLSPLVRNAWISYQQGNNPTGRIDHNVYKSDVYSLGLTFLYMATLKEPLELLNLQHLEARIKGILSHMRFKSIVPLFELMLKVNENERPNFIQLKQFYNENFSFLHFNLIDQARFLAKMVNGKVFSPRNLDLLYFKNAKISFKSKIKNIKLLENLYSKCKDESLNEVEREILSGLMKSGEMSSSLDALCKICNNWILIDEGKPMRSTCPCGYWMHEACIDEKLRDSVSLMCSICHNSFLSYKNQILCPRYCCPGNRNIITKGKIFKCKVCFEEFCNICKLNTIDHKRGSCIDLSLHKKSLKCGKCGEAAMRERGSFYCKCKECGYLCIVCWEGAYTSHRECCESFISLNLF